MVGEEDGSFLQDYFLELFQFDIVLFKDYDIDDK